MRTHRFAPAPRNLQATPGSSFTPAMAAWGGSAAQLGSLLSGLPAWSGYAVAAVAILAAYKRKIPMWAGLAGAGAAYFFLIRGNTGATGTTITAGNVNVSDGTSYQLTAASPGILSTDGSTLTISGTAYPVLSSVLAPDGSSTTYYVDTPGSAAPSFVVPGPGQAQ